MTLAISLRHQYPDFRLDIETRIDTGKICGITGPSGTGKTTLLRCVCGLEHGTGVIELGDCTLQNSGDDYFAAPHRRGIAFVPQADSLLPHLSVQGNLQYAAKRAASAHLDHSAIIDMLDIEPLLKRRPSTLSGGEARRVAIARALFAQPRLLLLDEPLTGLHPNARDKILRALRKLQRSADLTVLWVSHDIHELTQAADALLVLHEGKMVTHGTITDVLSDPKADFGRSTGTVWECSVVDNQRPLTRLRAGAVELRLPMQTNLSTADQKLRMHISADTVSIALQPAADSSILNIIPASVEQVGQARNAQQLVRLGTDAGPLLARLSEYSVASLELRPGMHVYAQIKGVSLIQ